MVKTPENRPGRGPNWAQIGTLVVTTMRLIWDVLKNG